MNVIFKDTLHTVVGSKRSKSQDPSIALSCLDMRAIHFSILNAFLTNLKHQKATSKDTAKRCLYHCLATYGLRRGDEVKWIRLLDFKVQATGHAKIDIGVSTLSYSFENSNIF